MMPKMKKKNEEDVHTDLSPDIMQERKKEWDDMSHKMFLNRLETVERRIHLDNDGYFKKGEVFNVKGGDMPVGIGDNTIYLCSCGFKTTDYARALDHYKRYVMKGEK